MKPWMRALVWLGLGGGIGFFAGYQVGCKNEQKVNDKIEEARIDNHNTVVENFLQRLKQKDDEIAEIKRKAEEALEAQREYLGGKDDETIPEGQAEMGLEEDPEMPMDEPEMPDDLESENDTDIQDDGDTDGDEIQPFHPEDLRPFGISASEYIRNETKYDKVQLDFYTEDGVIFDPEREERWMHPEQLLGLGWRARFISNDERAPIREAYIQNDTMGTLYKITRIDDSFERLYEEE